MAGAAAMPRGPVQTGQHGSSFSYSGINKKG